MSTSINALPFMFEKRWSYGNFKNANKFSEHDNYNLIQNYGEYIDSGYGKRYIEDRIHQSDKIFTNKEPFTKRDKSVAPAQQYSQSAIHVANYHKRFPKSHKAKIACEKDLNKQYDLNSYQKQKEKTQTDNSLNFESELYVPFKKSNLIATEPYRHAFNHPWKYSYKTRDYQTCTEQFRRVKTSCIDLSKY